MLSEEQVRAIYAESMKHRDPIPYIHQSIEAAVLATIEQMREALGKVQARYRALLSEKDKQAEAMKTEGDMYGWNFHTGMHAGAVEMHINMTQLRRAAALPANLDALHEARAQECERLAEVCITRGSDYLSTRWLREEAVAHRARKEVK